MTPPTAPTRERSALSELLSIAAPTVATMASYTIMTFVDAKMVSMITPADVVYVAAQGNGGIFAWTPISIMAGLVATVSTYVSQNLGAGHPEKGPAYAWNALWMCVASAALLVPFALLLPSIFAMDIMGHSGRLQALETRYAQILLFGALLTMSTRALAQYFFGMHKPAVVLAGAVLGNCVNLAANWVLVFGHLGAPAMGVTGSALGTVLGTAVEFSVPFSVFIGGRYNRAYRTRSAWRPSLRHVRDIARLGWAGAVMWGNEIICWNVFMTLLVGHFGEVHNAAGWIGLRYMHLSFMPAVGISNAVAAVVGRCIGAGRPQDARRRAALGVLITMGYMGLCAVAFVVFRRGFVAFLVSPDTPAQTAAEVIAIGSQVMIVAAVFQLFDAMGITISGALRGAGDAIWPGVVAVVLAWTCIIGLGSLLVRLAPELGSIGPWIGAGLYIVVLGVFLAYRFLRGDWMRLNILATSAGATKPAA